MARDSEFPAVIVEAIVVGIGATSMGSDWDLPKAPEHAVRFAEWLRKRAPAANIHLFISSKHHAAFQGRSAAVGVQLKDATRQTVESFLLNELPLRQADLLYIYWASHGNIGDKDQRILFYEDWKDRQHGLHLDLDTFLLWLRRMPVGANCPRQVAYIDACANQFEDLQFTGTTGANQFSVEKAAAPGVEQDFFLAAASGQQALSGKFSQHVLEALENSPTFPPDAEGIIAKARKPFEDSYQSPVRVVWRTQATEGDFEAGIGDLPSTKFVSSVSEMRGVPLRHIRRLASVAASYNELAASSGRDPWLEGVTGKAIPARISRANTPADLAYIIALAWHGGKQALLVPEVHKLVPDAAEFEVEYRRTEVVTEVINALSQLGKSVEWLRGIYRAVIATQSEEPARNNARTLTDMLDELTGAACGGEERYRPLFEFLLRTIARVAEPAGEPLRKLVQRLASPALYCTLRDRLDAEKQFRLQVRIDADDEVEDQPASVGANLFIAGTSISLGRWQSKVTHWKALETAVSDIVEEAREKVRTQSNQQANNILVEFVLDPPFFTRTPHRIVIGLSKFVKRTIGQLHPTVIRAPEILTEIRDAAIAKKILPLRQQPPSVGWMDCTEGACPPDASLVAFSFCPNGDEGIERIVNAILLGHPFMTWPEQEPSDWDAYRQALALWAGALATTDALPEALREARLRKAPEIGDQVVLFWDDPECPVAFQRIDVSLVNP